MSNLTPDPPQPGASPYAPAVTMDGSALSSDGHVLSSEQLAALLEAVIAVGRELHLETVLRRVVRCATELVGATYGAMGVLDAQKQGLADFLHLGIDADDAAAIGALPEGRGLLGLLITDPWPVRVPDLHAHPSTAGFPPHHPPMTTFLGVPVRVRGEVFGNLYLTDKAGGGPFTEDDERLVVALASVAGVAIENWRLHERVAEMAVIEDRERIARSLHDTVIQRMFAIGLALDGVADQIDDPLIAARLRQAALDLDETVDEIRTTVLDRDPPAGAHRPVRRELTELIDEAAERAQVATSLHIDGDLDATLGLDPRREVADQLFASARDAVVALGGSEGVQGAELSVRVSHELQLTIRAQDLPTATSDGVVAAIDPRARAIGGRTTVHLADGATVVTWTVPLDRPG